MAWLIGPALGILSYWCSRGKDGRLFEVVIGFGVLTIVYGILVTRMAKPTPSAFAAHFLVFEAFVIGALLVKPELDEMAGMLNYLLPMLVAVVVFAGFLVSTRRMV